MRARMRKFERQISCCCSMQRPGSTQHMGGLFVFSLLRVIDAVFSAAALAQAPSPAGFERAGMGELVGLALQG
eukprot:569759-Pyramimonas_sp.AAC.1